MSRFARQRFSTSLEPNGVLQQSLHLSGDEKGRSVSAPAFLMSIRYAA